MMITGVGFFWLSLAANQGISVLGMDPGAMAVAGVAAGAVTQVRLAPMGVQTTAPIDNANMGSLMAELVPNI